MKRRLKARIEYAKFLQDTAKEMAKEVQNSRSGEIKQTAEDLDDFLNKVRISVPMVNFPCLFLQYILYANLSISMCRLERVDVFLTRRFWGLPSCLMMNLPLITSAGYLLS